MKRNIIKIVSVILTVTIMLSMFTVLAFAAQEVNLVDSKKVLLIQNDLPWHFSSNTKVLTKLNANYSVTSTGEFTAEMLSNYGVVILANDQTTATYADYKKFKSELELFAQNGGTVVYGACDEGSGHGGSLSPELPGGVIKYLGYSNYNYIQDKNHPIVTGVLTDGKAITDADLYSNYCSHTCFKENTLPVGTNVILRSSADNAPTLIEYPYGEGLIIASGLTWEWGYDSSKPGEYSKKAMDDYFAYAIQYYNSIIEFTVDNVGINAGFKYNDTFFNTTSYIYNHELSKASLGLAISAMVNDGGDYKNKRPVAAEKLFEDLGFDEYSPYGYNRVPTQNSIACVFAYKNIDATKSSVIAIAIRGAGYEGEWSGNFNIGNDTTHEGFNIAKRTVLEELSKFVESKGDGISYKDNIKFWVTGYSRSAATANLVSATLNNASRNEGIIDDGQKCYKLDGCSYEAKDIFTYTFETPRNTRDVNAKADVYQNIFNIVNRIDIVPRVAPSAWKYVRYGKDCYLPSNESLDTDLYNELYNRMTNAYYEITKSHKTYTGDCSFYEFKIKPSIPGVLLPPLGGPALKVEIRENKSINQGVYLDNIVNYLAKTILLSPAKYLRDYQATVTKLVYTIKGNPELDKAIESELFSQYIMDHIGLDVLSLEAVEKVLTEALVFVGKDAGLTYKDARETVDNLEWLLAATLSHPNYLLTIFKNLGDLFVSHEPETTLAWMLAVDGDYKDGGKALSEILTGGETYRIAMINCPVDIEVYDAEGILRGAIINDEVQFIENGISVYIDENGQKCFYMPNKNEYRLQITGTDNGKMSCSFVDYNFDTCEKVTGSNYYDIPVSDGSEFVAYLDEKSSDGIVDDVIMVNNETGDVISKSEVVDFGETEIYTISTSTNSSTATVFGGGKYYKGEHAQVSALPTENDVFIGWYKNDELITEDITYKFRVEKDCLLEARFISLSLEDLSLIYRDVIKLPSNTDLEGGAYTITYESSDPSIVMVDGDGTVYAIGTGNATITCTITDESGNTISDSCDVEVSYTWWQWLIIILLFGWIWY